MHCCPPVKERGDVLWDLERVSRKWRQTALGCTVLWSFITVSSDVLKWYRVRDPHRMLEIWLERSRKRPLNITFGAFNGDQDPPPSLFPLLLLHIQRWRTLMLGIYFDAGIIGSLKSAQGKLPLLHSLSLFIRTKRDNPVTTAICLDAFSDAPNLHHMSLSLHECYRINNPSNSLTSLAVLNPDFLKNLTFPNLKVLCVTDYCQSDGGLDMFSAILQFIQRSRCQHLKALILGPTKAVVGSAVKEVFRIVPKLEILGIRVNKEDAFLEIFSLLQVSEDRALLPSLHVLDVTLNIGSTVTTQTAQLMVDLLEGRRGQDQMITKLESFVWRHARPIQALHLVEAFEG